MVALVVAVKDRERDVLDFIRTHIRERGYPPTLREMMLAFGWRSTNAPRVHLLALESHGLIERDRGVCRAIRVLKK